MKNIFTPLIIISIALISTACSPIELTPIEIENNEDVIETSTETQVVVEAPIETQAVDQTLITYAVVDTAQDKCYDNYGSQIVCPSEGEALFGQDAQYTGTAPLYQDNSDGTVIDLNTGLIWQQGHNEIRLKYYDAVSACESLELGGLTNWRIPSLKELYSLIDFRGGAGRQPYLDTDYFEIELMDETEVSGDTHFAEMMGQTWTSTIYTGELWDRPDEAAFFVNFLDGRIKSAQTNMPGTLFYRCVSGDGYGENNFEINSDGSVTDNATGLTWQQTDDGEAKTWEDSLSYCEDSELAGYDDWRLPDAKELQSIVDYSSHDPALDLDYFGIVDPDGWFWTSTTHGDSTTDAVYICFGECISYDGVDVHGAGAQRSDPKTGSSADFPTGRGGQEDQVRVLNYSRCVRGGLSEDIFIGGEVDAIQSNAQQNSAIGGEPDLEVAAELLGVPLDLLRSSLGPPPPDLAAAAEILNVTIEELKEALGVP